MTVNFYFEHPVTLKERTRLKLFIGSVFKSEKRNAKEITYIFCSDEYLLNMNQQFLKHDYYTDIITFDLSDSDKAPKSAEIYISVERIKDNARIQAVPMKLELHRVIIHGILHLCGHKDKSAIQKKRMRTLENKYLAKYNPVG